MSRTFGIAWLLVVSIALGYLGWRTATGWSFQTDLMALLPSENRDPVIDRAKKVMAEAVVQRVVLLVGHSDAAVARGAAAKLATSLNERSVLQISADRPTSEAVARVGVSYFPYRAGLISEADRRLLLEGRGGEIVTRVLSQIYGLPGTFDSRTLRSDPFLLLPAFLSQLPVPASRLNLDQGMLTARDGDVTWALVTGKLIGEPYALEFQDRFIEALDASLAPLRAATPDLQVLRLGALFYAREAAVSAMAETSWIGIIASIGAVTLIVLVFRSLSPALLSLLATGVGLLVALAAGLAVFEELHVTALLFGAALIGVTVDYSIHYFVQVFTSQPTPAARLAHVMPGLTQGVVTTLVGFGLLALAPFPGLRQIAAFSIVGVVASFLTVILWLPSLDWSPPRQLGDRARHFTAVYWSLWSAPNLRPILGVGLGFLVVASLVGFARLEISDDVRRQQSMSAPLQAEEARVRALTGFGNTAQFFIVQGATIEEVLARQEALGDRLGEAVRAGALADWLGPARFVPSAARQADNAALVNERLIEPHFATLREHLHLTAADAASVVGSPLSLETVIRTEAFPFVAAHILGPTTHLVSLAGLTRPEDVRAAAQGIDGVHFIDPTADISSLLGDYRRRAVFLLCLSILAMAPFMAWRHGWAGALRILLPPTAAAAMTPGLLAVLGLPFTFFGAMALILVLAIGVDYAIFCAEDREKRHPVTVISLTLTTLTTVLSFGLLAWTSVAAVQSFGAVMLVGDVLAFLLAPIAAQAYHRQPS